jgi:putative membrane protein
MRSLLRSLLLHTVALYALPFLIPGVSLEGGFVTVLFGGILLTVISFLIRPILNIITYPFNVVTFGVFSLFTNALLLYLLTVFIPGIVVKAFTYPASNFLGFSTPDLALSTFFAFLLTAAILAGIINLFQWLMN